MRPACTQGCCGTTNLPVESACASHGGSFCDGEGVCVACVTAPDCAPTGTVCATTTCTSNACVTTLAASGFACAEDGGSVCDGAGDCVECVAATDCPSTGSACSSFVCSAAHRCTLSFVAAGAEACSPPADLCDGEGHCAPLHCLDGVKDDGEADVDCGGTCPRGCRTGGDCNFASDCASHVCAGGVCAAPSCSDGVQNGTETDIDCGGSCSPCGDLKHCSVDADCVNGDCFGDLPGTCVSCMDGEKDGDETDVDCGGSVCDLEGDVCGFGKSCAASYDCGTGLCTGGMCVTVPNGQPCGTNAQCTSGNCVESTVCCASACSNMPPSSCGTNGLCALDGLSCALYAAGTGCGATVCAGGAVTRGGACDGLGTCVTEEPAPCPGGFACVSASGCAASCTNDGDCVAGYYCAKASATCAAKGAAGVPCAADDQCASASCNAGTRVCG